MKSTYFSQCANAFFRSFRNINSDVICINSSILLPILLACVALPENGGEIGPDEIGPYKIGPSNRTYQIGPYNIGPL
jgi:hypothetical protein